MKSHSSEWQSALHDPSCWYPDYSQIIVNINQQLRDFHEYCELRGITANNAERVLGSDCASMYSCIGQFLWQNKKCRHGAGNFIRWIEVDLDHQPVGDKDMSNLVAFYRHSFADRWVVNRWNRALVSDKGMTTGWSRACPGWLLNVGVVSMYSTNNMNVEICMMKRRWLLCCMATYLVEFQQ